MTTQDEKMGVLKMIEEGKIDAEQGIGLINALGSSHLADNHEKPKPLLQHQPFPQWLRVIVTDLDSGKKRVNVRLPASLINTGSKMGARFAPDLDNIDPNKLKELIHSGQFGQIFDLVDEEDREHIELYLE